MAVLAGVTESVVVTLDCGGVVVGDIFLAKTRLDTQTKSCLFFLLKIKVCTNTRKLAFCVIFARV